MSPIAELKKIASMVKSSNLPLVVLSLSDYERMREDLEMYRSRRLAPDIIRARAEVRAGKTLTLTEVKKKLKAK